MAITGIDTIDGKQIIAAGAVSAKSAEMAYNDENGNPITGYLTAVPTGTMNESAFGYDSDNKISSYNGSAFAGGSYQPSGNYIPYTAIDGNAFKTNSGLKIATFIGSELRTNFINNNFITLQSVNSTLGINNQVILATGSLTLKTKSDSAYVDREKIHKWDSASDYIQNNSATINEVNTSYQTNSGTYLTAVPDTYLQNTDLSTEDGKVTAISGIPLSAGGDVPEGVMVESGLEYNAVNEISGYNGSAIAQYGAEKQWLQHDDTLVHVANSAQYALGVNVSAVQTLMGLMGPKLEEATLAGYWNGHEVKQMLLTGTFNTNVNSDVIPVNSAYSAYERKWIDPSNSFIFYGSSANVLPTTWVLGATTRLGSLSLLNGIVRARSNDTSQTNCTAFVTIKWCEM